MTARNTLYNCEFEGEWMEARVWMQIWTSDGCRLYVAYTTHSTGRPTLPSHNDHELTSAHKPRTTKDQDLYVYTFIHLMPQPL